MLKRFDNETETFSYAGTWKGNVSKDDVGIICFFEYEFVYSTGEKVYRHSYFTLTELDGGSVVASFGVMGGGYVISSLFIAFYDTIFLSSCLFVSIKKVLSQKKT